MSMQFSFKSYTKEVMKDIKKQELQNRKEALKHLKKAMQKNLNKKGRSLPGSFPGKFTGTLKKGIKVIPKMKSDPNLSIVGSTAPHSHLMEYGWGDGKEQNKRPFFYKTLKDEERNIIKIMQQGYL